MSEENIDLGHKRTCPHVAQLNTMTFTKMS